MFPGEDPGPRPRWVRGMGSLIMLLQQGQGNQKGTDDTPSSFLRCGMPFTLWTSVQQIFSGSD